MDFTECVLFQQVRKLQNLRYENEFKTMQYVMHMPADTLNLTNEWLKHLKSVQPEQNNKVTSTKYRLQGNEALKSQQLLVAAHQYTDAILAAKRNSVDLALAHANRAQVLLEFGYYFQAYDDCVCALKSGYPNKLRHKLLLRQATCAAKQNNVELLQIHIEELNAMALNVVNKDKLKHLQDQCLELVSINTKKIPEKSEIQNRTEVKGNFNRCLKANSTLLEHELIFSETAYSCVTVGYNKKCEQCLTMLYIPFPCTTCFGKVHYCSVKCLERDYDCHKFECEGYRINFFANVGIGHLALRTVLRAMPELISLLKTRKNALEIWKALSKLDKTQTYFAQTMSLQSKLTQDDIENIKHYAFLSYALLQYLVEGTDFFKTLCVDISATVRDWQLVVSSLFLRHVGQFIINAHEVLTLQPSSLTIGVDENECCLLKSEIWVAPLRLQRGHLHRFNSFSVSAAANFPYLSMANHSCTPSFQTVFNGRCVSTLASKMIPTGEEVFNCYTLHYKYSSKLQRQAALEEHNFVCKCEICSLPRPDSYYVSFVQYFFIQVLVPSYIFILYLH